jgi:methyl-accepting chemotaxis protein
MRIILTLVTALTLTLLPAGARAEVAPALVGTEAAFGSDARVALGAYRGMVEEHAQGVVRALRVIASTSEARSAKWDQVKPLLTLLSSSLPTDATAWFVLPDGSYHATEEEGIAEENLKDRAYFPVLMSGKEVFGDLVISKSTNHRSVIVAAPVLVDGKTVAGVGVSLRVRLLSELVDQHMPLPADSYFYALERDTRIALHRYADRMFKTPADVGDEALGEQFKTALQQDKGTMEYTLNGKKMVALYERSPVLGWYFFIAKEMQG